MNAKQRALARREAKNKISKKQQGQNSTVRQGANTQSKYLAPILSALGGQLAPMVGLPGALGSMAGEKAGQFFKNLTGFGEYKVKGNTLYTNNSVPLFKPEDRIFRVRHKEFIQDLKSSINFANLTHLITPSNAVLFPWLSQIAKAYKQYRFKGLVFTYVPSSGNAVANNNPALGTVVFATNYNPTNNDFSSKKQAEVSEFATSQVPSVGMIHPIECDPQDQVMTHLFTGTPDSKAEYKFYYPGKLNIIREGMQTNDNVIGELWVTYDVEFTKPSNLNTSLGLHIQVSNNDGSHPLGVNAVVEKYNTYGVAVVDKSASTITLNSAYTGYLRILVSAIASGTLTGLPSVTLSSTISLVKTYDNDTASSIGVNNTNYATWVIDIFVRAGGVITFANFGTVDATYRADIFIQDIENDVSIEY